MCLPPSRMSQIGRWVTLPALSRREGRSQRRAPLLRRGIAPPCVQYWPRWGNPFRQYARRQTLRGRLHGVIHCHSSSRRERRAQPPRPAEAADRRQYPHVGDNCSPFVGILRHFASTLGVDTSIPIGEVQVSTLSVDAPSPVP